MSDTRSLNLFCCKWRCSHRDQAVWRTPHHVCADHDLLSLWRSELSLDQTFWEQLQPITVQTELFPQAPESSFGGVLNCRQRPEAVPGGRSSNGDFKQAAVGLHAQSVPSYNLRAVSSRAEGHLIKKSTKRCVSFWKGCTLGPNLHKCYINER